MTKRGIAAVTGVVLAATAAGEGWMLVRGDHAAAAPPAAVPTSTAAVMRTDLVTTIQVSGTLGFAGSYPAVDQGAGGTVTAVPAAGQVVSRGQSAYEIDGAPVFLMYGARPAWRALFWGVPDGPDVRQLDENLVALGFATSSNLTVGDRFDGWTTAAVERWQRATGQTATGRVDLGSVLFEPGALRIAAVAVEPGQQAHDGDTVLTATSTTSVVALPVPANETYLVHVGDAVQVTLPNGRVTPGRVASVSTAASAPVTGQGGAGGGPGNGNGVATVPAVVSLTDPGAAAGFDQAPVTVDVTNQAARGVLAVPVTALVALAGGGYGVYLRDGVQRRLVAVTPGLFANTLVQVTGPDLREGDTVEVPAG